MLKKFSVANFKNFEQAFSLDLTKTKSYLFNEECISGEIVRFAQIYGKNGSGKSNLGLAILDISLHLTDNSRGNEIYRNIVNCNSGSNILIFYYEFLFGSDTVVYEYKRKNGETPFYEHLKINNQTVIFLDKDSTESPSVTLMGAENLVLDAIKEANISIVKYVNANTLLPSNKENTVFRAFILFVKKMLYTRVVLDKQYIGYFNETDPIDKKIIEYGALDQLQQFLQKCGFNYQLSHEDRDGKPVIVVNFKNQKINIFDATSTGGIALLFLFYWLMQLDREDNNCFIFFDEFDAFYHHELSEVIVEELRKRTKHQIVVTTHNTNLLNNKISRPDCNFLMLETEAQSLSNLTEKELRLAHNIEKMYREGGFHG